MKRKFTILILLLLPAAVLLCGCTEKRRINEAKACAENYLSGLKTSVSDETLRLTDAEPEAFGELYAFTAFSEKYNDDFRINVNADNSITDSYFAVYLQAPAEEAFAVLADNVLPEGKRDFTLTLKKSVASSALSAKTFRTVREAHDSVGNVFGLVTVRCESALTDEELSALLSAMQKEAFYGDFSCADDVRVFHISETEINYTRTDDPAGEVNFYDYQP